MRPRRPHGERPLTSLRHGHKRPSPITTAEQLSQDTNSQWVHPSRFFSLPSHRRSSSGDVKVRPWSPRATAADHDRIRLQEYLLRIFQVKQIPFNAYDMASDENARKLWKRKVPVDKQTLPGLLVDNTFVGVSRLSLSASGTTHSRVR